MEVQRGAARLVPRHCLLTPLGLSISLCTLMVHGDDKNEQIGLIKDGVIDREILEAYAMVRGDVLSLESARA